jgi:hypothetical protein
LSLRGVTSHSLLFHGGVGWPTLEVMREHLQNLISQGYMAVVELATYRVAEDPTSPPPVGGYVVVCAAFYEWGFGVSSHHLFCSLLQFYGLEP